MSFAASISSSFSALKLSTSRSTPPSVLDAQSPPLTFDVADTEPPEHDAYSSLDARLDALSDDMYKISTAIHSAAEVCFRERKTHDIIASYLEQQSGWKIARGPNYSLETCIEAVYEHRRGGRSLAFIAEMDSLSGLGHANGHNMTAAGAIGVAIALAATLVEHDVAGRVVIFATPASLAGAKLTMLRNSAFRGLDAVFSLQAGPYDGHARQLTLAQCEVEYMGEAAHTAAPWHGVNALDAGVLAYQSVTAIRQQFPPDVRVSGLVGPSNEWRQSAMMGEAGVGGFSNSPPGRNSGPGRGGSSVVPVANSYWLGTMPTHCQLIFDVRCAQLSNLALLQKRITSCFEGAAQSTGTEVKIRWLLTFFDLRVNTALASNYSRVMRDAQSTPQGANMRPFQSTDLGNISYEIPTIQPVFSLGGPLDSTGSPPMNHSRSFIRLARSREAHEKLVKACHGIASTALRLLLDQAYMHEVKSAHETDRRLRAKQGDGTRTSWVADAL